MQTKRLMTLVVAVVAATASGALGGLLAFSYCVGSLSSDWQNIGSLSVLPSVERHGIVIQENKALKDAIAKVSGATIGVKVGSGKSAAYGSGVVLTSDGLAAVPHDLFPPGANAEIFANGQKVEFEVVKRDKTANLAILKLKAANLATAGFYNLENLKLGERIFLAGVLADGRNFANEGMVRDFTAESIATNIFEKAEAAGAPAFDIEGNILGIAQVAKSGQVSIIPISKIKEVSGL